MKITKVLVFVFLIALFSITALSHSEIAISIQGSEYEIPAILTVPDIEGFDIPAGVIMVHGFGSSKNEVGDFYKRLANDMADRGITSVRFDFPGSGDHTLGFEKTNVALMVRDTMEVLDWFEGTVNIDKENIGMVGFSLGGVVVSSVASNDSRIKALALWSTPGNMAMSQLDLYNTYYGETKEKEFVTVDLGWRTINLAKSYFDSRYGFFPIHDISKYQNPLLVIAGENDEEQPYYAREFAFNAGSHDVTLKIVDDADHIYHVLTGDQSYALEVINTTANWLEEKLR